MRLIKKLARMIPATNKEVGEMLADMALAGIKSYQVFGDQTKALMWLSTENPLMGGDRPFGMIIDGKSETVDAILNDMIAAKGRTF